jgi:hypothetical protein
MSQQVERYVKSNARVKDAAAFRELVDEYRAKAAFRAVRTASRPFFPKAFQWVYWGGPSGAAGASRENVACTVRSAWVAVPARISTVARASPPPADTV